MINFSRAFDLAWERMVVILFRPFDIGKWLVIGFSAFLAGLLEGGNANFGVPNWFSPGNNGLPNTSFTYHSNLPAMSANMVHAWTSLMTGTGIAVVGFAFCIVLAVVILFYWLGARGQFLFLDNVVRNRAEVAWPWGTYARQGNNLFAFILLWLLMILAILLPLVIAFILAALPFFRAHHWPEGAEWLPLAAIGAVYFVVTIPLGVLFFLFRELGVPLMFRNGITARAAFVETWKLTLRHPGNIALFVLLRIALLVGILVVAVLLCCLCCCVEQIPYVGTVMLLPALIYIRCFTLECLAQYGPEYDVWTVDVPPGGALPGSETTPPPPPG
jgi:hypothetical protein